MRRVATSGAGREQGRDQHEVQQHRGERGGGEALAGLESAREQGGQRDQQQIGEGDPAQIDGELVLQRARGEAGRQAAHQPGHRELAQDHHAGQHQRQHRQGLAREPGRGGRPLGGAEPAVERHEGGGEGALGEQAAQEVGELQADEEGVGDRPGAQCRSDQEVAREAGDARERGEAPHRQGRAADAHPPLSASASCRCTRCILLRWAIFRPKTSLT